MTDAGLKELTGLKKLKWLSIVGTQVTDAGIAEIKEAIPELTVHRKDVWEDLLKGLKLDSPQLVVNRGQWDGWRSISPACLGWLLGPAGIAVLAHALSSLFRKSGTSKREGP